MPRVELRQMTVHSRTKRFESYRLFSVHTRNYLRRRVWRYFRNLGKTQPDRYIPAVMIALKLYDDADAPDGVALLDNWGLMHILFHHCPILKAQTNGWTLRLGRGLNELTPAPVYPRLWSAAPQVFFELLRDARLRVIRQWVLFYIRQNPNLLRNVGFEELFRLLNHDDAEIATLAAELIAAHPNLASVSIERWLNLLSSVTANALDAVCSLAARHVIAAQVPFEAALALACGRPVPLVRLGFRWLQGRFPPLAPWGRGAGGEGIRPSPSPPAPLPQGARGELAQLWRLTNAQSDLLRAEMVRWARRQFSLAETFQSSWVLDFLDSRHEDVRAEGWAWLLDEPRAHDDVELWQKLLESPYDDVRLKLVDYLQKRYDTKNTLRSKQSLLNADLLRLVWASVLLNIHRGGRSKPAVVQEIVERMQRRPEETALLLPLLKIALRSVRGPEWRAGLAGIVQMLQRQPEMKSLVEQQFPELQMVP